VIKEQSDHFEILQLHCMISTKQASDGSDTISQVAIYATVG
jgi:hypothetical protein